MSVYNNKGDSGTGTLVVRAAAGSGFRAGERIVEIVTCGVRTADGNGDVVVSYSGGLPAVLYPMEALVGSGICGR